MQKVMSLSDARLETYFNITVSFFNFLCWQDEENKKIIKQARNIDPLSAGTLFYIVREQINLDTNSIFEAG
jgi:hypothetical protein